MRRRDVLGAVAGAGAWPLGLHAQQTARVARIGYLTATFEDQSFAHVFRQTLYSLGYIEGQNVAIDFALRKVISVACLNSPPSLSSLEWT
jgi:hypothetical protein